MIRALRLFTVLGLASLAVALVASPSSQKSLYDRLGGKTAIVSVVDDFVANCAADARINKFFAATDADKNRLAAFKNKLVDQICEAAGGPCKYAGRDMKTAHAGMGIDNAAFDALVEDLTKSLNKFSVGKAEQDQLLGVLGPMRPLIVGKK